MPCVCISTKTAVIHNSNRVFHSIGPEIPACGTDLRVSSEVFHSRVNKTVEKTGRNTTQHIVKSDLPDGRKILPKTWNGRNYS